jgi:RNase P/RNase MRP subunit p30
MMDIVFPKGNEPLFVEMASKLGYTSLCFVYDIKSFPAGKLKYDIDVKYGVLCSEKDVFKAKKLSDAVFVKAPENARHLVESNKNISVFDFEYNLQKDFLHQKRSGLNHILCSLCLKNNIKICFSFNSLLKTEVGFRDVILGRIEANIRLCRKYKNSVVFGSFASSPYEMRAFKDLSCFFKF